MTSFVMLRSELGAPVAVNPKRVAFITASSPECAIVWFSGNEQAEDFIIVGHGLADAIALLRKNG